MLLSIYFLFRLPPFLFSTSRSLRLSRFKILPKIDDGSVEKFPQNNSIANFMRFKRDNHAQLQTALVSSRKKFPRSLLQPFLQDVLLYNFFGSSPMSNDWRIVYEFLKDKDLDADSPKSFPSFSQTRHNILCSELKQLYVAITRTRQRLWICENDVELSEPLLDYWTRLCLVRV